MYKSCIFQFNSKRLFRIWIYFLNIKTLCSLTFDFKRATFVWKTISLCQYQYLNDTLYVCIVWEQIRIYTKWETWIIQTGCDQTK